MRCERTYRIQVISQMIRVLDYQFASCDAEVIKRHNHQYSQVSSGHVPLGFVHLNMLLYVMGDVKTLLELIGWYEVSGRRELWVVLKMSSQCGNVAGASWMSRDIFLNICTQNIGSLHLVKRRRKRKRDGDSESENEGVVL